MAVPEFQVFILPVLQLAADRREHTVGETAEHVADQLGLTHEDRQELLASGNSRVKNRVSWAFIYLERAKLLERIARGRYHITERGIGVLRENPERIDMDFLRRFPEFVEFQTIKNTASNDSAEVADDDDTTETPEERLETAYQRLRKALASDLLDRVKRCSPQFFETLVVDLLVGMGYGGSKADAARAVGRTGDGGIDGIIKEDRLGLDVVLIQAKRWEDPVGAPVVRDFAGSLEGQRARKGVLITTSRFTPDALDYVTRIEKRIVLIDGEQLAQYMINHGVGVVETARYTLKKIDSDYFGDE